MTLALAIDPALTEAGVRVTLSVIEGPVVPGDGGAPLTAAIDAACGRLAADLNGATVSEDPAIAATRAAYRSLGKDPARYRPSAEALRRRVQQGKGLYRINNLVDVTNLISLTSGVSIGTYDAARIVPPVTLRRAGDAEPYEAIGRGPMNIAGLPVLADANGPFGSPTSDSERTKITGACSRVLMVLFGFGAAPGLEAATGAAADALTAHCGAADLEIWTAGTGA